MRRIAFGLAVVAALLAPARAQDVPAYAAPDAAPAKGPDLVNPESIRAQTEELHDSVANPASTDPTLHDGAARLFESIQRETPLFRPAPMPIARERVDGHLGTVDGMIKTAQERWDHYKLRTTEVPAADLESSIRFARSLRDQKRADFDQAGVMPDNQMGAFRYAKASLEGGIVELNQRMALIASRIGEAFAYATLVHESTHAKAREAGRLNPKDVIDGELEAYRVQYYWVKALDPKAERLVVLHSTMSLWLKRHPTDQITRQSIAYVEHLLELYDTEGKDEKIKDMIKRLGYHDGDDDRDGGVKPGSEPVRA